LLQKKQIRFEMVDVANTLDQKKSQGLHWAKTRRVGTVGAFGRPKPKKRRSCCGNGYALKIESSVPQKVSQISKICVSRFRKNGSIHRSYALLGSGKDSYDVNEHCSHVVQKSSGGENGK
jgi:hypothetical protein